MNSIATPSPNPLITRIWHMLARPREEWAQIATERTRISELYVGYAIPILAASSIASFLKQTLFGTWMPLAGTLRMPVGLAVESTLASFVFGLVGLFVLGLIVHLLAPMFAAQRDLTRAMKVAVYCVTPACVGSVCSLLPALGGLIAFALLLYGLYVLYLGVVPVMDAPKERALGYTVTIVLATIVLSLVIGAVIGMTGNGFVGALSFPRTQAERQHDEAAQVGNAIGNFLGTDKQGKEQLSGAIENLTKAGAQADTGTQDRSAAGASSPPSPEVSMKAGAGLLTALGGALGGSHRVDPVDYKTLAGFLPPALSDLKRGTAEGSNQQALGVKASSARAVYTEGKRKVEVTIADASGVSGLMDLAEALPQTTSGSSDTGIERQTTVAGYRAHEKFDSNAQHGEIGFIVAKRFQVDLVGEGVDLGTLEQYASNLDLSRLAAMKDAGAHSN
jgi:Yip1 domain